MVQMSSQHSHIVVLGFVALIRVDNHFHLLPRRDIMNSFVQEQYDAGGPIGRWSDGANLSSKEGNSH